MSYDLAAFAAFCPHLHIEDGSPLELEPFQHSILADHFGDAVELVVVIPKKNGKTTLLAALALFHIRELTDAECIIVAASRDQAGVMFRQAVKMVKRSGYKDADVKERYWLDGVPYDVREGYREIRCNGGRAKVMAADADTADGAIPTLALVDELHRHPNGELYGILADGLGARRGRMVTISTAGHTERSPLGQLRRRAHAIGGVREDRHLRVIDGSFVLHEWALNVEDDPEDLAVVKLANPASIQTLEELARRRSMPTMTIGRWLRFACGVWTHGEEPPVRPIEWDRCRVDIGVIEDGEDVILAPSVGGNAAIGIAALRDEGRVAVRAEVLEPAEDSMLVRCENRILELCERYRVLAVHHPTGAFVRSGELLEARGVPMIEAAHSAARSVAASGTFNRLLRGGLLMHDGDPTLRAHVLSASVKTTETGERYRVADESRALIAVAFAAHAVTALPPELPGVVAL